MTTPPTPLPCPFCGTHPTTHTQNAPTGIFNENKGYDTTIQCENPNCHINPSTGTIRITTKYTTPQHHQLPSTMNRIKTQTINKATRHWNKRHNQ